jgi:hypothetical protein
VVWQSALDGRTLTFHLAAINNQNFVMQDEETGSWWQQITGRAIAGPLKGRQLERVFHDELTFEVWTREAPAGRVLRPAADSAWIRFSADWEAETARMPVATRVKLDSTLPPRTMVIGVAQHGAAKAYPLGTLARQNPIIDQVGGEPVVLLLGDDGQSARGFRPQLDGEFIELFLKPGSKPVRLVDAKSGSEWDFQGVAVSGPLQGRRLERVLIQKDYWFDWKTYHPETELYKLGR